MPAHIISSEQQRDRMLHTPIPKLIVSLSIPTLASQLISVFYNTADTYFVSKLSTSASAAVGVVFSLMSIIQAFGFGIGMGCGSIISRSLGNRDNERADRTASSAFFLPLPWGFSSALRGSARSGRSCACSAQRKRSFRTPKATRASFCWPRLSCARRSC